MASQGLKSMPSFVENLTNIMKSQASMWMNLVQVLGLEGKDLEQWQESYTSTITETCNDMNMEVEQYKVKLIKDIEMLLQKSENLCKNLGEEMPEYGKDEYGLIQEKTILNRQIEEYENKFFVLNEQLKQLKNYETELCKSLGTKTLTTEEEPLKLLIERYQKHNEYLENEKFQREETFLSIKSQIIKIVDELNYKPSLEFEKIVLSSNDSLFLVTDHNMRYLKKFHDELTEQYKNVKLEISELRDQIEQLWKVLDEDLQKCNEFRERNTGNSLNTLNALKVELKRCDALKKANMKIFIDRFQKQLMQLWDQCHYTDAEREHFSCFMNSDTYTEDLLDIYEIEVKKQNAYLRENSELFALLTKFENLWNKMLDLERQAAVPDRYKNRGGQLLKEEKERNKLAKLIPEIDNKLRMLDAEYTERTGKTFLTWGKTITEYLENKRENREEEKKLKLSARKQQREQTLTPAKSCLSLFPATSMQNLGITPTIKRKIYTPSTPHYSEVKRKKLQEFNAGKPVTVPKLQVNNKTKRFSLERNRRIKKCRRIAQKSKTKNNSETSLSSEYEHFMVIHDLSSKTQNCRSTLFKSEDKENQPAQTANQQNLSTKSRTPQKTPSKLLDRAQSPHANGKLTTAPSLKLIF